MIYEIKNNEKNEKKLYIWEIIEKKEGIRWQ